MDAGSAADADAARGTFHCCFPFWAGVFSARFIASIDRLPCGRSYLISDGRVFAGAASLVHLSLPSCDHSSNINNNNNNNNKTSTSKRPIQTPTLTTEQDAPCQLVPHVAPSIAYERWILRWMSCKSILSTRKSQLSSNKASYRKRNNLARWRAKSSCAFAPHSHRIRTASHCNTRTPELTTVSPSRPYSCSSAQNPQNRMLHHPLLALHSRSPRLLAELATVSEIGRPAPPEAPKVRRTR